MSNTPRTEAVHNKVFSDKYMTERDMYIAMKNHAETLEIELLSKPSYAASNSELVLSVERAMLKIREFIQNFDIWAEAPQGTVEESEAFDNLLSSREFLDAPVDIKQMN